MKTRFSTLDIQAIVKELQRFLGMRVVNVYDIDSKTYMVKIAKPDMKAMILIESGNRLHSTDFDWPKNPAPSGFSMKLRKHLRGRRVEVIQQFGIDRIVDLQFGSGEAAYHLIIELYDRGNLVLTDSEYTILNILRPRTDESQDVRFAVRECYPIHTTKQFEKLTENRLRELLLSGKDGDNLKKILMPNLEFGPALLEHCLRDAGFTDGGKIGASFNIDTDFSKLYSSLTQGEVILTNLASSPSKGYIIQKSEKKLGKVEGQPDVLLSYDEFHPYLFKQHIDKQYLEFDFFDKAVDEYFSKIEGQRLDLKALQQEKSALKKLENVRKDQDKRLGELRKEQEGDFLKGQLIEMNLDLVDRAILVVRSALANQIDWTEIEELVKDAQSQDDPVAAAIKSLRLDLNHITMLLSDPYSGIQEKEDSIKPMRIDIDLGLSAYANSRRFFDMKKKAVVKEQKTMDSSTKAFKSAEKKTMQTLKDVATAVSINKTRKTYWFEKFLWFISSENFLVIGGRDQQQNELIVKRYLRSGDVYVHADLHGASSVIIKNNTVNPVPPKTLNEAGTMAICNSAAWDAKVVTSAWWVHPDQVSKTAPTGEYLTTGSFMVRGKKNYLPPSYLVYGFGFVFKLEESSVSRHAGERKIRVIDGEITDTESEVTLSEVADSEVLIEDLSGSDTEEEEENTQVDTQGTDESIAGGNGRSEEGKVLQETDSNTQARTETGKIEVKTEEQQSPSEEIKSDENIFPDTSINLQHVKGDKFSYQSQPSHQETEENDIISTDPNTQIKQQGAKLTAKQRRDMKKNKKSGGIEQEVSLTEKKSGGIEQEVSLTEKKSIGKEPKAVPCEETPKEEVTPSDEAGPTQTQAKRGQKSKQKKMKEKYGDQDEEERLLRMEILASAGQQKESKRKKKKGKAPVEKVEVQNVKQQQNVKKHLELLKQIAVIKADAEEGKKENTESILKPQGQPDSLKEEEESGSEDEKGDKDDKNVTDDNQLLESLTGLPVGEDELLFAIPVCAPYQAINNYKYKVKLLPGSSKKGKATKTALNMFMHEKESSSREKDLMRIMKDVDLSRNIPGKVKVAAPNLNKMKRK